MLFSSSPNYFNPNQLGDKRIRYQPEIDGLRAVAIICVVGFHVGVPGFAGGFVGVDVFFVISGFLITSLLLTELHQRGSIDLAAFFARRARRLLPAFFLVLAITLLLGVFLLVPVDAQQQRLADAATATALYISNLHFAAFGDDYFDPESSLFPLLHTWSLAVEAQFYLLWPLVLLGTIWFSKRVGLDIRWVIASAVTLIFIISIYHSWDAAESSEARARLAFFAFSARAWELAIGAALALTLPALPRISWGNPLLAVGVTAIAVAVVLFNEDTPFPGIAALVPTLGTAAIITGICLTPEATIARVLSFPPLVVIGLLSYSWYLWHWPLLALARAHTLGVNEFWRDFGIAMVALGLSALTYVLVENPIHRRRVAIGWSNAKVLGASAAASLLIIAAAQGLKLHAEKLASREDVQQLVKAKTQAEKSWTRRRCENQKNFRALVPLSECLPQVHSEQRIVLFWGDSHVAHWVEILEATDEDRKPRLLPRWMGGCPPLLDVVPVKANRVEEQCARFNSAVLKEVGELHREGRLAGVVLVARWSAYLDRHTRSGTPGRALQQKNRPRRAAPPETILTEGLRNTLSALTEHGIKVLVIAPAPEQQFDVPLCLARRSVEFCSESRASAEKYRARALRAVRAATKLSKNVYLWDPLPGLCNKSSCPVERGGILLYADSHHLTGASSQQISPYIGGSAEWLAFGEY